MNIQLVEEGDIIVEGKATIAVRRVERNACSKKGVHINDNACYDNTADVVVRKGERDLPSDVIEEIYDEWDFDDKGPCPRCDGDHSWCQMVQPDEYGPVEAIPVDTTKIKEYFKVSSPGRITAVVYPTEHGLEVAYPPDHTEHTHVRPRVSTDKIDAYVNSLRAWADRIVKP